MLLKVAFVSKKSIPSPEQRFKPYMKCSTAAFIVRGIGFTAREEETKSI